MLRVLMQSRSDAFTMWGGDTTQMVQTRDELLRLGLRVDICLDQKPDLSQYDLVHIFNIQTAPYGLPALLHAKRQGKPVCLSPIYWDMRHLVHDPDVIRYASLAPVQMLARLSLPLTKKLLDIARSLRPSGSASSRSLHRDADAMLTHADLLLPNSFAEAEILALLFNAPWIRSKTTIVPNGITISDSEKQRDTTAGSDDLPPILDKCVLEVGRIEPVKGQLKVIRALLETPKIPLVFIGKNSSDNYYRACRALAERRGNTWFIPEIPHTALANYYRKAKVHALPSLRESPGLATLEAALQGVNCVVGIHGPVAEYFGRDVWYCDPADSASVKSAILSAYNAPKQSRLRESILKNFTWKEAARKTAEAYNVAVYSAADNPPRK